MRSPCSRNGCKIIQSNRYSPDYGYLCNECFEELVARGPETNIQNFMYSAKQTNREQAARARFEMEFPNKDK